MKTLTISAVIAVMTLTVSCAKSGSAQREVALSENKPKPTLSTLPEMDSLDSY